MKGNCDADLVLNVMVEFDNFDKAVIVSGDGDFYSLVQHLYENGKLKQLLVPDIQNYSGLLKPAAKEKIECMNFLNKKIGL